MEKEEYQRNAELEIFVFTSVAVIGDRLFSSIRNNHNHVRKYERYLLLVITTLGTNVIGRGTFFYDGIKIYNLGLRSFFE